MACVNRNVESAQFFCARQNIQPPAKKTADPSANEKNFTREKREVK